ncbi:DUF4439 domain-containing protein [Corynebacterium breve]|uniref:DUF4439 domain-containing protein n=1 Tax=Corynebacterium breve TaxID=3049799 RepID=A0ABY8VBY8_9CORY|nr:DUF4439 domain-containing protein [Corynebacterium breve]WIM66837.1 DUF4439 domain-containing protein [Corynebacterium breve]
MLKLRKLAALTVVTFPLAGCGTVLDMFGPEPNPELVVFAQQADADAESLVDDPAARELRATQAKELYRDITRLCGVDESGQAPSSCEVDTPNELDGGTDTPRASAHVMDMVVEKLHVLPDDSVDLVTAQAIDFAALAEVALPDGTTIADETDATAAREMLSQEYAAQYGLGLASAYADDALQERLDVLEDAHQQRIDVLVDSLDEAPPAATGYEFAGMEPPTTTEAAAEFVEKLEGELVISWRTMPADAKSAEWLDISFALAAHAQYSQNTTR